MEKWLSFIVPVYNVEDYLSECVDSLLNQDVPSELYEIILYDDGSTDGSLRIAQKYGCLLYTSPSPRDISGSRMPSSA